MHTPPLVAIVDDDVRNRFALTCVLEDAGFACESFEDGSAFLAQFQQQAGCVVLDLMMPGIDGLQVLREMRLRRWHTAVITLGYGESDRLSRRSLEAGAFACLKRPVDCEELIQAVRNALVVDAWNRRERRWKRA